MADLKLELVLVPVSDVDRAKAFYEEKLGFHLDVDHAPNQDFRVVQLTPPGSACSITFGKGITTAEPGSYRGTHLVVDDIEAVRDELVGRGIDIGAKAEIQEYVTGLAEDGVAVVFVSSELEEVVRLSDRIVVLKDRRVVGELVNGPDVTAQDIVDVIVRSSPDATDEVVSA